MAGTVDNRANNPQPGLEQTGATPVRRISRRTLFGRAGLALSLLAATGKPLIDAVTGRGSIAAAQTIEAAQAVGSLKPSEAVYAEEGKPVKAELAKLPFWATSSPEDKSDWDKLRPNVREFMQIAVGTGDRELVDAVNYMLDRSTETLTGGEAVGNYKIVTVFRLNPNPTGKAPFSASWGPDGKIANQLDFSLDVDKKFTSDPQFQVDSLDTASSFMFAVNAIRIAEALAKTQDSVSEANSLLEKNKPNIGKEAARLASRFAKRAIDQRLYEQWGLKGPAQAVQPEPEEAAAPAEAPTDTAATELVEASDNVSAEDFEGVKPEGTP